MSLEKQVVSVFKVYPDQLENELAPNNKLTSLNKCRKCNNNTFYIFQNDYIEGADIFCSACGEQK